jgi:hypothetical protein
MAEWTLTEAQQHLDDWLAAERALATGQSYNMNGYSLTRADLQTVRDRINFWRAEVARLTTGRKSGPKIFRVVPRDL